MHFSLLTGLFVVLLAATVIHGKRLEDGTLSRRRRETKEECDQHYQFWDAENKHCNSCLCPAGQQSTAEFCGYGVIVGEPGCEPCPFGKHHSGTSDEGIHCHPCKTCDPDAIVVSNCTKTEDTVCACKAGMGFIGNSCVNCRDHSGILECPVESVTTSLTPYGGNGSEPKLDETSKNAGDCTGYIVGMLFLGIVVGIVICIVIYIVIRIGIRNGDTIKICCIEKDKKKDETVENPLGKKDNEARLPLPEIVQRFHSVENDSASASSPNDTSRQSGEIDALIHHNGRQSCAKKIVQRVHSAENDYASAPSLSDASRQSGEIDALIRHNGGLSCANDRSISL